MTIPNILTLFRIALIPVIVVLFFMPGQWTYMASAVVFATAAFTDLFDGYVARVTGQTSALGAFLDPVADKLMVAIALTLLVQMHNTIWLTIPAIFIIGRELAVSALREWMGKYGTDGDVGVAFLGKVKTTVQMIAITGLLANPPGIHDWPYYLSYAFLYVSFLLTAWSLYEYLVKAWPDLSDGRAE